MISKITKYFANFRYEKFGGRPALEPPVMRYVLRPVDGWQYGYALPMSDPAAGDVAWKTFKDTDGIFYVAVCDFCNGNCGQCGTSIGQDIPFDFDVMAKNGKWDKPGWGFYRSGR